MKSYTVANDMCSSLRRKYGAKIPSYMHNRPKVMGQHCKKRLEEGRLMVEDTARLDDEDGRYTVQSQATADVYKVSLTEPSCECKDYQRSLYPCKHIYAVLFSEGKTFMDLPAAYVNSPWFQLDYKIMSLGSVISQPQPGEFGSKDHCEAEYPETEDAHVEMEMQGVETLDELPKPMRVQLTTASECRELLRQLTSLSYKVTDDQLLRDLCQSLHASIATLNSHCECGEDGLQKEPGTKTSGRYPARRKTVRKPVDSRRRRPARKISQRQQHVSKTTSQQASTSQLAQARTGLATSLLPRRRGPSALTGRVGIGADMRRPVAWPDIVSRGQKMVSMSEEHRIQSAISSAEEVSSAILDLDTIDPADDKRTDDALEALANPLHKLTGEDMERVSAILTKQWPDVTFQNPHYIQRPQMFSGVVKYGTEKYAQVIHMEDDEHWVAVTNLGCRGRVRLFDSAGLRPTFNVKSAVASLERSPSDKVVINVEAVQRQEGGIDCGLFAIANLVECLNSADPRKARYNQKKMRGHLITCLRSKQLSVFPKVEAPVVLPRTNTYSIQFKVYCKCRGPHQAKQLDESYNWMVQCGTCKEWYHRRCITLLATDIDPFTGKVADDYLCKRSFGGYPKAAKEGKTEKMSRIPNTSRVPNSSRLPAIDSSRLVEQSQQTRPSYAPETEGEKNVRPGVDMSHSQEIAIPHPPNTAPTPKPQPPPPAPPAPQHLSISSQHLPNQAVVQQTTPNTTTAAPAQQVQMKRTKLSTLGEKLTEDYVRQWTFTNEGVDDSLEDVKFVIKTLHAVKPVLITKSSEYSVYFRLILNQGVGSSKCSMVNRLALARVILEAGWIEFIKDYYDILYKEISDKLEGAEHTKYTETALTNLCDAMRVVHTMLKITQKDFLLELFDRSHQIMCDILKHDLTVALMKTKMNMNQAACQLQIGLLNILLMFVLLEETRSHRSSQLLGMDIEETLAKYESDGMHPSHLESTFMLRAYIKRLTTSEEYPQLPQRKLRTLGPSDDNVQEFLDTAAYVKQRLCHASLQDLVDQSLVYQYDFAFMIKTAPVSGVSSDTRVKIFEASIEDGTWHKLLISYYYHVNTILEKFSETEDTIQHAVNVQAAIRNISYGFNTIANGTDICRNSKLQQQMLDQFLDVLADELTDEKLLKYLNSQNAATTDSKIGVYIKNIHVLIQEMIESFLTTIHNFLFYYEPSIPILRERGLVSVARNIRDKSNDSDTKVSALLVIAYLLIDSDDKEQMKMSDEELIFLIQALEKSMLSPLNNDSAGYHPEELINGLNRIAVIDVNKLQLIDNGILPLLTKSLNQTKNYSPEHREAAINAIWNLAFTEESRRKIMEQKGLMPALHALEKSKHKCIRTAVAGALWQLEEKERHKREIESKLLPDANQHHDQHIMLSYNHLAKAMVFRVRDMLVERGYKVWIDEDQITAGGSTLEAMSDAVENSCLVLIFFSEAYYKSKNCRAEAEYAFETSKPFLPIQVQPGYNPHSWLGMLCGSKYRYTMCKPDRYESDMANLFIKIEQLVRNKGVIEEPVRPTVVSGVEQVPIYSAALPAITLSSLECSEWSAGQVTEWLEKNNLDQYKQSLYGLDGEMLAELVILSHRNVDTFYSLIGKTDGIDLIGTLKLSTAIKKLVNPAGK